MKKAVYTFLVVFASVITTSAQLAYAFVTDQTIIVNSLSGAMINGNTRNGVQFTLPAKTVGYIYRISISPRQTNVKGENPLYQTLQTFLPAKFAFSADLMKYAVNNSDGNSIDLFVFTNPFDYNNFKNHLDGQWIAQETLNNRSNSCFYSRDLLNPYLYFGFKNNNKGAGLSIRLEVTAIVDQSNPINYTYSYPVYNPYNQDLNYEFSVDNKTWQSGTFAKNTVTPFSSSQEYITVRLPAGAQYNDFYIKPYTRNKLFWSSLFNRWEVKTY